MQTLFQMAEKWLNVPFRWHGKSKNGCDCIGLIIGILYENNIMANNKYKELNKIKYGTNLLKIDYNKMLNEILHFFKKTNDINKADLLLVKYKNSPIHFIVHEKKKNNKLEKIIHVTQENGKVFKTNFDKNISIVEKFELLKKQQND